MLFHKTIVSQLSVETFPAARFIEFIFKYEKMKDFIDRNEREYMVHHDFEFE